MKLPTNKFIYLDFDGVLHDEAVYWHPKRGIYMGTPNRVLFEWTSVLDELLAPYPDVGVVLSTSWVRVKSFEFAKSRLPAALQRRVVGATFHNREMQKMEFDLMSRWSQIWRDVQRRNPENWFAIDNDCEGWPPANLDRLVLTNDRLGLSEVSVQTRIRDYLLSWTTV